MDKYYFKEYYHLERSHWWFTARLKILECLVKKYIKHKKTKLRILNVGVATGATTKMLEKFGEVVSVEYDEACCAFLREKVGIHAINASLTDLPFENHTFDLVCAFDVIEHIEDDIKAIQEIKRVLSEDGFYFITVPAFNFLWSKHDEINHHFRRYTLADLSNIISKNKLTISYKSYFNFWLFPPIALVRMAQKIIPRKEKARSSGSDAEVMNTSNLINKMLFNVFLSEKKLLHSGIRFPFGISILVIGTAHGHV